MAFALYLYIVASSQQCFGLQSRSRKSHSLSKTLTHSPQLLVDLARRATQDQLADCISCAMDVIEAA